MKRLISIILVIVFMFILSGCNMQVVDTTYKYDRAILEMPDGVIVSGKVDSWKDYDASDQIQVKIEGTTYLVHSTDIVLINDK